MIRDLDFIRNILLAVEKVEVDSNGCNPEDITDYLTRGEFYELNSSKLHVEFYMHLDIMKESLLIDFNKIPTLNAGTIRNGIRMTSRGYDYLDSVRDKSVWNKTKEKLSTLSGSASLQTVQTLASETIKSMLS